MRIRLQRKSAFVWLLAGTCVLLVPFFAIQFTSEVHWRSFDFLVMGTLLLFVGSLLIFLARKAAARHFPVLAILVLLGFFYVWAELAVGIFFYSAADTLWRLTSAVTATAFRYGCAYTTKLRVLRAFCLHLFAVIRFFVNPACEKISNQVAKFSWALH